ncbi:MAG: alanine--tRNA ligase, partial [Chloroflexi bacterium]|nr:alanine--tRNA ligase [Chloroflexota bacterium]
KTDLLAPLMDTVQELTGQGAEQRAANVTPYRVIADHSRAATFLIADGVVPGNTGRNYVCRMIVRRAARFGSKIGLNRPFMAKVAAKVIDNYGSFYPELERNRATILDNLTREEERFQKTVEAGLTYVNEKLGEVRSTGAGMLDGKSAFELYATHGIPLEITRDIARETGLEVDEAGFKAAMEEHRLVSGAGKAFGPLGGEDVDIYRAILDELMVEGKLDSDGVKYDPYHGFETEGEVLAMVKEGASVVQAHVGDRVEVVLPATSFYVESGGQVADTGTIVHAEGERWEIRVDDTRKPAAGMVVHVGEVVRGAPRIGDLAIAAIDRQRRQDIMRNHTATHLLHAELHAILGAHARQAGSLVAPDRLRFDFTHPEPVTQEQLDKIEAGVNQAILENYRLNITYKSLTEAMAEGAMALFGEKYGETVRTITIGGAESISYELCGGTHVNETGDIGSFIITSEGSAAAGIRRIEAVTGRGAYDLIQRRLRMLKQSAGMLNTAVEEVPQKVQSVLDELDHARKQIARQRQELVAAEFVRLLADVPQVQGIPVLAATIANADGDSLRQMTDRFRDQYPSGVVVLGSVNEGRPVLIASVTDDLVQRGIHAGALVKRVAQVIGGSGGGRPNLAQAGGKDGAKLPAAIAMVGSILEEQLAK